MKVIILCGGAGTRLKEETEFKPKPMVDVGNKPLLWHIMKIYSSFGFNHFILALGYKGNYIKDFFLNTKAFTSDFTLNTNTHKTKFHLDHRREIDNFKITFVDTGMESSTGERIIRCKQYLEDDPDFMVTYGDGVANLDIKKLVQFHQKQNTVGTITGVHPRSKFGLIKLKGDNSNFITEFQEKPILNDWINGGFMVFKKEVFKYLKPEQMDHGVFQELADINQLSVYKHNGFWFAVDTYRELEDLNKMWREGNPTWRVWP